MTENGEPIATPAGHGPLTLSGNTTISSLGSKLGPPQKPSTPVQIGRQYNQTAAKNNLGQATLADKRKAGNQASKQVRLGKN